MSLMIIHVSIHQFPKEISIERLRNETLFLFLKVHLEIYLD